MPPVHVPQPWQRQVQQAIEQGLPQRQHDLHVQLPLAVVAERPHQVRHENHRQERGASGVQAGDSGRAVERGVQEDAVDDEPHEQRLDHLESGRDKGERQYEPDRIAVGRQPAKIVTDVVAACSPVADRRFSGPAALFRGVEPPLTIVVDECAIAAPGRTLMTSGSLHEGANNVSRGMPRNATQAL
jgi:hypothetical protein